MPQISVVVPIYNMSGKLENLAKWLPAANDLGFQIILICNCCTDETQAELQQMISAGKYKNTEIHECDIPGPGRARNFGKRFARGLYTIFWDSDDVGFPSTLQELVSRMENSDLLVANYSITGLEGNESKSLSTPEIVDEQSFSLNPGIWRCLFRTEFIIDSEFGTSSMGEDQVFLVNVLRKQPVMSYSQLRIYDYCTNFPNQLTAGTNNLKGIPISLMEIRKSFTQISTPYIHIVATSYLKQCLSGLKRGNLLLRIRLGFLLLGFFSGFNKIDLSFPDKLRLFSGIVYRRFHAN